MFTVPRDQLPYDPEDRRSIEAHGQKLVGRTVWAVAEELGYEPILESTNQGKGKVGDLVEAWFRIERNARPEPDFPCGVELKVAPLKQNVSGSFTSKERMVLSIIPYFDIVKEEWGKASVRHKFGDILSVVYLNDSVNPGNSRFQAAFRWTPPEEDLLQIQEDWTATRDTVREGRAHELTESVGRLMGPCTKGTGTKKDPEADMVGQPFAAVKAKRRAFAFKAGYVWVQIQKRLRPESIVTMSTTLVAEQPQLRLDAPRILAATGKTRLQLVETALLQRLHGYAGQKIRDVCERLGVAVKGNDKSLAARLLNGILGISENATVEELAKQGVQVKTVHARKPGSGKTARAKDLYPFEAMSFPAVDLEELLTQDWSQGTVDFPEEIQRLLIIPTFSPKSDTPQEERVIGPAFFWSPTAAQMTSVEQDWHEIQSIIASGGAAERPVFNEDGTRKMRKTSKRMLPVSEQDLPGERPGRILHMRPKTSDADDKVPVPGGEITAQCFWLNKGFVHELLKGSDHNSKALGITAR